MLRVAGRKFDVDGYLKRGSLQPHAVYRRGQPRFPALPESPICRASGCNIVVSTRDFDDYRGQIRDAVRFLRKYGRAVRALRRSPGIESASLDFGIERRDVAVQSDEFPEELVRLAGRLGLGLEMSHYPPPDKPKARKARRPQRATPVTGLKRKRRRTTR